MSKNKISFNVAEEKSARLAVLMMPIMLPHKP